MSEEEPNLPVCMEKLKIMPRQRPVKTFRDEHLPLKLNPFHRTKHNKLNKLSTASSSTSSLPSIFGTQCACKHNKRTNKVYKRVLNTCKPKVLREPIIVLNETCTHNSKLFADGTQKQDFKSIVARCERLSLTCNDNDNEEVKEEAIVPNFPNQFRERESNRMVERTNSNTNSVPGGSSCSQQAMVGLGANPNPPCDVTIDELASYFETFVHIPKKMSSMAEMMYI